MSNKYQVIIAENEEVLFDCMEGDTSAGESFFADSLEEAERILGEQTAVPGKGGVIIPPDSDEPSLMVSPMRTRDDIDAAETEFFDKAWYDGHQSLKAKIKSGEQKLSKESMACFQRGEDAARTKEDKYGRGNLGPLDDFERGMIYGKLSALRWVLGDEWDNLDT
jgi:hypothetical protein